MHRNMIGYEGSALGRAADDAWPSLFNKLSVKIASVESYIVWVETTL